MSNPLYQNRGNSQLSSFSQFMQQVNTFVCHSLSGGRLKYAWAAIAKTGWCVFNVCEFNVCVFNVCVHVECQLLHDDTYLKQLWQTAQPVAAIYEMEMCVVATNFFYNKFMHKSKGYNSVCANVKMYPVYKI